MVILFNEHKPCVNNKASSADEITVADRLLVSSNSFFLRKCELVPQIFQTGPHIRHWEKTSWLLHGVHVHVLISWTLSQSSYRSLLSLLLLLLKPIYCFLETFKWKSEHVIKTMFNNIYKVFEHNSTT